MANLMLGEEKELKARYKVQAENELDARRVAKSSMKRYLTLINDLRDHVSTLQIELETREEELKIVQKQRSEWQECTTEIEAQLNSEITRFEAGLQKAKDQTLQFEKMVPKLEKNNDSLVASDEALCQDNIAFHHKNRAN